MILAALVLAVFLLVAFGRTSENHLLVPLIVASAGDKGRSLVVRTLVLVLVEAVGV